MRRRFSFFVATRGALRTYWGSAALIIVAGAVALAAVVPVARLAHSVQNHASRLRFSTIRLSPLGFHWGSNVTTPGDSQSETIALLFQLLLLAGFATLVLAALSILSLSAARASSRFPEIAVRRAVGASRRNLLSAALAEGAVLGAAALIIGLVAGHAGLLTAVSEWPGAIDSVSAGPAVVAGVGILVIIVIGALFQLLTTPSRRIAEANPQPLELYIPALQLGMGLTVLVASTMLVRHAAGVTQVSEKAGSPGTVLELVSADASPEQRGRQYRALLTRLQNEPGIRAAGLMSPGTLVGLGMIDAITTDCGYCVDGGLVIKWHAVFTTHHFVSADTFGALGIDRVEGRVLTDEDRRDSPPVAVISETLARRHFQYGAAVGRLILLKLEQPEWYTVVGVVKDREAEGFGAKVQPRSAIYLSALQHPPTNVDLLIRTDSAGFSPEQVEVAVAGFGLRTVAPPASEEIVLAREAGPLKWFGRWFSLLGWAMLLITTASTFVLMRFWVRSLRHELGLRRAAGARRIHLLRYILVRAVLTALAGVAMAIWFGPALWDSLPDLVIGLEAWSVKLVAPLALILLGITLAGALVPALKACRDTPTDLLGSVGD